jgi:hypothetical protein
MHLFSWLHKRRSGRPQSRRTPGRKPTLRFRPQLETLERRDVPSTLTVTNNLDSGAGSLRAEIAAANPGDTINFAPSLDGQTITLTSGQLVLNHSLTIDGPGAGQLAISGGLTWRQLGRVRQPEPFVGNSSRVFEVIGAGTNVTLSGLTITDGSGRSVGTLEGGAILNIDGSTLTLSGCTVSNSFAYYGGGIYNYGATLNLVNSTLSGNVASVVNDISGAGEGGGLYSAGSGQISMTDCTLSGNSCNYQGGAVWIAGTTMTIDGYTVTGNTSAYPGAIYDYQVADTLTVTDTVFSGNTPYAPGHNAILTAITGPWTNGGGNTFA